MPEFPQIPGYKIEKELGKGGMADVYLATQESLDRKVAIKVLLPEFFRDQTFTERFLKEARTAAKLEHTNIINVYDVGKVNNSYYIVMEYLNDSLRNDIQNKTVDPIQALDILKHIADALDYAHSKGFIHRDIKPENILFRKKHLPVLVDFGIARAIDSSTKLTKTGMSIGTPFYMSPEQARGHELDGRSDIYSLGVLLFEVLTGSVPYQARDTVAIAIKHIQDPIPVLPEHLKNYQPLIDTMMAKEPKDRPQTGRELIELIDKSVKDKVKEVKEIIDTSVRITPEDKMVADLPEPKKIPEPGVAASPKGSQRSPLFKSLIITLSIIAAILLVYVMVDHFNQEAEDEAWQKAKRLNAVYSYNNYLRNYPKGIYNSQARKYIEKIETDRRTERRFTQYLKEAQNLYSNGKYIKAKEKITSAKKIKTSYELRSFEQRIENKIKEEKRKKEKQKRLAERRKGEEKKRLEKIIRKIKANQRVTLRSVSKSLSKNDVRSMLKKYGFYDYIWSKNGNFKNDFLVKTIQGDKVVVDRVTGLIWHQPGLDNYANYKEAKELIRKLNRKGYAGYSDWRLPTLEEGASLMEAVKNSRSLNIDPVFPKLYDSFWTVDRLTNSRKLWYVSSHRGSLWPATRDKGKSVCPVRSIK